MTISHENALGSTQSSINGLSSISLSEYGTKAIATQNPLNLLTLAPGATYQVTHPDFIVQFFFNNHDIIGMVLKRNPKRSIKVRWCFFRSCEENQLDYNATIAKARAAPFANGFFEVKLPAQFNYQFQGMLFSSDK